MRIQPVTIRIPPQLRSAVEALHAKRQAAAPHRKIGVSEVYLDLLAAGLAQVQS